MTDIESLKKLALLEAMHKPIKLSSQDFSKSISSSPQTASRKLQTLEQDGHINRTMVSDGQWITISKSGVEALRKEYYEYQEIFTAERDYVDLVGTLFTGLGEGQYYLAQQGYLDQFEEKLGFYPFPGTLNLNLNEQSTILRRKLSEHTGIEITGFKSEDRTFGGGKCFHSKIKGENCAVIIPDRTHYPPDVVEILAPSKLRDKLDLKDGDEIILTVML
ncbi:MAG: winged helix-turn-helix domain-containing protein/riboflavin kinase [Halobacteriota archaeon]|nr:winged helix-turn-helix domain-containing protein/riboflavin kinase [Halobacteriota archaeon]